MNNEPPNLPNIAKEVSRKGYLGRARQRAQRRKSLWNLLLIPLGLGGIAFNFHILFHLMWGIHTTIYPAHTDKLGEFWQGHSIPGLLLLMPLFLAAVPLGMLLANCIAWCLPPARKIFEREAQGVKWASFRGAMSGLAKLALIVVPICLLLSFIGAITLRNLN